MTEEAVFKRHAIHIEDVRVKELYIRGNVYPEAVEDNQEVKFSISIGYSEYDTKKAQIIVGVRLETTDGNDEAVQPPYSLKVEVVGLFKVDEVKFQIANVDDWARRNAPFILFPYLREQVYALTIRCGYQPLILPLVEVPTFRSNEIAESTESSD